MVLCMRVCVYVYVCVGERGGGRGVVQSAKSVSADLVLLRHGSHVMSNLLLRQVMIQMGIHSKLMIHLVNMCIALACCATHLFRARRPHTTP